MKNKSRILNIGCGDSFYGTDRIDIFKTKATTKVVDVNQGLPYPDNYFEEIYARSVLEHIRNLGIFSDECYRVLKKGGKIWLRTDHAGFLLAHIWKKHEPNRGLEIQYESGGFGHRSKEKNKEDHHYTLFVESHLKHLFKNFRDHKFEYIKKGGSWWKTTFYSILPKNLGAYHIEMEAAK